MPVEHRLKAYALLERITPLPVDCGKFCSRACCNGDSQTGMELFPYEDMLLKGKKDFSILPAEDKEKYGLCVCEGFCRREERPLACRIFPFFPLVYTNKRTGRLEIRIIQDPRGRSLCPLVQQDISPQPIFERRLRRATRILLKDPVLREYILKTGSFLMDIEAFRRKLIKT